MGDEERMGDKEKMVVWRGGVVMRWDYEEEGGEERMVVRRRVVRRGGW